MIAIILTFVLALFFTLSSAVYAKTYGATLCSNKDSQFYCYTVKGHDSWQKLFPNPEQRDLVMRLNRMNIPLERGMKIAVPKDFTQVTLMTISPFVMQLHPSPQEKIILVSLADLAWGAYDASGTLISWGPISAGRGYCPDIGRGCHTSLGNFVIYRKEGRDCVSTKFPVGRGGAPMPYCMFFNGGFALHGSYEVPGYNASHGCVRIFVNDAKWLNENFVDEDEVRVVINR